MSCPFIFFWGGGEKYKLLTIPLVARKGKFVYQLIACFLILSLLPIFDVPAKAACVSGFPSLGWQAIRTTTGSSLTDPSGSSSEFSPYPSGGTADIASANGSPLDWFSSGDGCDFYFRMRLKGDPRSGTGLDNVIFLVALGRASTPIVWVGVNGDGNNKASRVYVYNPTTSAYISNLSVNSNDGSEKINVRSSTVGGTTEYLLEWRVANALLPASVFTSPVGFYAGTSQSNSVSSINADCIDSLKTAGSCTPIYTGTLSADLTLNTDTAVRPTITSISPVKGPISGGTNVTITGTNLANASQVYFGGKGATINSSTNTSISVTVSTPTTSTVGTVDVQVITPGGERTSTAAYTYYDAPTATTVAASGITSTRGSLNGSINAQSDSTTVSFCYGTESNLSPCTTVTATPSSVTGTTTTPVSYDLSGLTTGTPIYYRVIGTNAGGTTQGSILSFTPALTALSITNSSLPNGTVGVEYFVSLEATGGTGVYSSWAITSGTLPAGLSFDTTVGHITGTPTATASSTSLTFQVTDSASTTSSKTLTLTISAGLPTVTTNAASSVAASSATLNGTVTANGASTSIYFCLATSGGVSATGALTCASTPTSSPTTTSNANQSATASATSLTSGQLYFFQVYATNSAGTSYGKVLSFVPASAPSVTTSAATSVTTSAATLNGSVTANGSSSSIFFCLATSNTTNASGALTCLATPTSDVSATLSTTSASASGSDLNSSTTYYFQIYSTNSTGTTYGSVLSFTTSALSPALTPTFDTPVKTSGGFTVNITNWSNSYTWGATVSSGSVSIGTGSGTNLPLTVTGLSAGGSATITANTSRSGYSNGSATVSGSAKANQSITLASLGTSSKSYPYSQALNMSTSGSSGTGAVTYAIASGGTATGCSLSNATSTATITATTIGTCLITATIASDANYESATSSSLTFTFSKANQTVTWSPTNSYSTTSKPVTFSSSASSSGPGTISYSVTTAGTPNCSIDADGKLTWNDSATGTCVVTATAASNNDYNQGTTAVTFTITSASLLAALTPVFDTPVKTNGGFTVNITNYDANYTWSASVSAGSVSRSTSVLTVTGLTSAQSATISVTTSRTGYNDGSATVTGSAKTDQIITFTQPSAMTYGDSDQSLSASTDASGLSVTLTSNDTSICTIVSGKAHIVTTGTCSITAAQTGNADYNAATSITRTFTISEAGGRSPSIPVTVIFTITFFSNYGANVSVTQIVSGTDFLRKNDFVRERFSFKGWSRSKSGKVELLDGQLFSFSSNQSLYAVWEASLPYAMSHRIVFPMNGGTPLVFISGGIPISETDVNSPLAKLRYDAICELIQELGIDAQVIRGVFDGPSNEIEVFFYWPKDFDDGSDTESSEELNIPNARSFTINFLTDRSTRIPNSVRDKFKKFLDDAKSEVSANPDKLEGFALIKFNEFIDEVEKVSIPGIEPQIYVSGGPTQGADAESSALAKSYFDSVCQELYKRGVVGQIIQSVFIGQDNVIEITFYWGPQS